ncbi:MAG: glucose-1-phosphate cytidylyltransferase [Pseudomonadota bacterium]
MKAVILAGGLGTRLAEETGTRPKPMVEIGGKPILWHIMKIYSAHGVRDFVVCLGYKGYMIKEFFANYVLHGADVTFDVRTGGMEVHQNVAEPWRVTLAETGETTMTGGRLRRVAPYLDGHDVFCLTYGDGVSDVDVGALIKFHEAHDAMATLTAVTPPGRFGALAIDQEDSVSSFVEKPVGDNGLINGGFFVLNRSVIELIDGDDTVWEREPLETLAKSGNLRAYRHGGFWRPMDTLRDKLELQALWDGGEAPWKVW